MSRYVRRIQSRDMRRASVRTFDTVLVHTVLHFMEDSTNGNLGLRSIYIWRNFTVCIGRRS